MLRYMLGTNICIATIRNKTGRDSRRNRHHTQMCISTITVMELMSGIEVSSQSQRNLANVEGFIARLDVLDYDAPAAAHTAQIRAELTKAGAQIGPHDQMIAGHARSRGLVVVTSNTKEFERVPGLRSEDWMVRRNV